MERSRNRAGGQSAQGADDGGWLWSLRNASCRRERTGRLPGGGTKTSLRLCGPEGRSEHERGSAGACGGCTPKWHGAAGGQGRRGEQTAEAEATKDVRAERSQGADPEPAKGRHPGGAGPGGRRSRSERKRRSAKAGAETEPERSGFCRSLRRLNPHSGRRRNGAVPGRASVPLSPVTRRV